MSTEEKLCQLCGTNENLDLEYFHGSENQIVDVTVTKETKQEKEVGPKHYLCNDCMLSVLTICTCTKKQNSRPEILTFICPCDSDKSIYTPCYFPIKELNPKYIRKINDEFYVMEGCRGCKYQTKDIQKNIYIALQSAVDFCMFRKEKLSENLEEVLVYQGDSLDDDFVKACDKIGITLGEPVDI